MSWPPRVSIKRIGHILLYGSSKPSSLSATEAWLKPNVVDCVVSPFSQEQYDLFKSVSGSRKVAICGPHEIRMVEGHTRTERESVWHVGRVFGFPLQGVHRYESP
jgi:hypothetical protein